MHAVTILHVVISLVGIVTGLIVLFGLFKSQSMPGMTAIFLITTILTNATGFMFPFEKLLPSHIIAILSLVLLAIACVALYSMKLSGAWRSIYVITAITSLYLNIFVLVIQSFLKIGSCMRWRRACRRASRPSPSFRASCSCSLLSLVIAAVRRYRPALS